jgi:hypothetical protein
VKADAYGHGVEAVAETLVDAGRRDARGRHGREALVIRRAGITAPVLVLFSASDRAEAEAAVAADLTLVVVGPGARSPHRRGRGGRERKGASALQGGHGPDATRLAVCRSAVATQRDP